MEEKSTHQTAYLVGTEAEARQWTLQNPDRPAVFISLREPEYSVQGRILMPWDQVIYFHGFYSSPTPQRIRVVRAIKLAMAMVYGPERQAEELRDNPK